MTTFNLTWPVAFNCTKEGIALLKRRKPVAKQTLNDSDRQQWIDNDEGLYNWKRSTRLSMREFIKQNRAELDECILAVLNRKPG